MRASKIASTSAVVGRRLRRYLGALLALGFGVAWWSFEPPSRVEAAVPVIASTASPVRIAGSPVHVVAVAMVTPPARPEARRIKHVRRPQVRPRPRPVDPPVIETPVDELPPVVETPPVIETPPVPEAVPVAEDPIPLPPIRTRSS